MKYFFIISSSLLLGFYSCTKSTENYEELSLKYDSILVSNSAAQNTINSLEEIANIIDSIDEKYDDLNFDLEVGTEYASYTDKMNKIMKYVENAEATIANLENKLGKEASIITNIKKNLSLKTAKVKELEQAVESLNDKNEKLFNLITVQGQTIHNKAMELELKTQEVALIQAHIEELLISAKVNEANAFYARAEALEEAANRTQLAPRKKKETLRQALELYRQSFQNGNKAAAAKIEKLQQRLN
ncbi:MAG: hypothetical protein OEX22_01930 [Cyclobacteriaceae bacterium]|nr:hypothetical protein [Cyclobacteriaceae bacterium]